MAVIDHVRAYHVMVQESFPEARAIQIHMIEVYHDGGMAERFNLAMEVPAEMLGGPAGEWIGITLTQPTHTLQSALTSLWSIVIKAQKAAKKLQTVATLRSLASNN